MSKPQRKGKEKGEDAVSTFSKISVFSTIDNTKIKKCIDGYLETGMTKGESTKTEYTNMFAELTSDCRMSFSKGATKIRYVVLECQVQDSTTFRLSVKCESDLSNGNEVQEILCRAGNDIQGTEWLIAIENCLRNRLKDYKNELDCARGYFLVKEISTKAQNFNLKGAKKCQCFYYNQTFRCKGLDGPMTSSFTINNLRTAEVDMPLTLIVETPGRSFLLQAEEPEQFNKWVFAIEKDLEKQKAATIRKGKQNEMTSYESDFLVGPTPDKMIRLTGKYLAADHILETRDYSGCVNSFFVERLITLPEIPTPRNFNLLFMASVTDATPSDAVLKLYVNVSETDYHKWVQIFDVDLYVIAQIIECLIMEIELRRMMQSETSGDKKKRTVSPQDVFYLMSLEKDKISDVFGQQNEWPVGRLERVIQMLLKVLPEPLVPYKIQTEFISLGKDLCSTKVPKESHYKESMRIVGSLPHAQREILEKLTIHIYRLTQHYSKNKAKSSGAKDQQDGGGGGGGSGGAAAAAHSVKKKAKKSEEEANTSNAVGTEKQKKPVKEAANSMFSQQELMIWIRLGKYIFRFHEQEIDSKLADEYLPYVASVMLIFLKKFVENTKNQMGKSSSDTKKKELEDTCAQQ